MSEYTGMDNLEVMADAVNYNGFILTLVRRSSSRKERILDFGAGIATFAKVLAAEGYNICCVEPDVRQADLIKAAGLPVSTHLDQIGDASMDFIYTLNVLEHIEDDEAVLKILHTKLKPAGRLLIYVPAFPILYSSMDRKVGHVRRYTKRELVKKLHAADFQKISVRYADSLGFFASLIFRFAGNKTGDVNRRALIVYDRFIFPLSRFFDLFLDIFLGKNAIAIAIKGEPLR